MALSTRNGRCDGKTREGVTNTLSKIESSVNTRRRKANLRRVRYLPSVAFPVPVDMMLATTPQAEGEQAPDRLILHIDDIC